MSSGERTMPVWHERHLRAATDAAGVALWSWNVDTDAITMDESAYDLWEVFRRQKRTSHSRFSQKISPLRIWKGFDRPSPPRVRSWVPTRSTFEFSAALTSGG